jgi:ABC-type oligopeptide transport system substrate-binding subunit
LTLGFCVLIPANQGIANEPVFAVPNDVGRAAFDPTNSVSAQERFLFHLIYEPLIRLNPDHSLNPALAKGWKVGKKSITFQLNTGHRFSDGAPVTAESVKQSFVYLCSEKSKAKTDLGGMAGCNEKEINGAVQVKGTHSLMIRTQAMPTVFLHQLATSRALVVRKTKTGLVGSGPYKIKSLNESEVVFRKNPVYHSVEKVRNDGFTIKKIDEGMIHERITKNDLAGALMYLADTIESINAPFYQYHTDKAFVTQTIFFNNQRPPFDQPLVRQAILAEAYNSASLHECVKPNKRAFGIIPIGLGGSIGHIAPKKMEEIKPAVVAKALAKYSPAVKVIQLHQHVGRKSECLEANLKKIFAKFNLELKIKYHSSYGTLWPLYMNHNHQGFIELLAFKNREAFSILQFFVPGTNENFANIESPTLKKLLASSQTALTSRARFQSYRDAAQHINDQAHVAPLYYTSHAGFLDKCIRGSEAKTDFNPFQFLLGVHWDQKCLEKRAAQ